MHLQVVEVVSKGGVCQFYYSEDGTQYKRFGEQVTARKGKWIGAKVGLFAWRQGKTNDLGYVDIYDLK